ncbi:MAG: lipopolysaccharide biosynthesis protein [Limisphaerales bacterium]
MSASRPAALREVRREQVSFFRQSGWMLLANGIAGAIFSLVHSPAGRIAAVPGVGKVEYASFGALLDSLILLGIPAGGLQAVFAQLASGAIDAPSQRRLRSTVRSVSTLVFGAWALAAAAVWLVRARVQEMFQISNPWAVAFTLGTVLIGLLYPVFAGLLQGTQRFFWLGNAAILSAAGRFVGVTLAVVACGSLAAGAMAGVMLGAATALGLTAWSSRSVWWGPSASGARDWSWVRPWLALTIGLMAGNIMLGADPLFVQSTFGDEEKAFYVAAGRVGRALVFLTMPLALVLFPRVARSATTGMPTEALKLALGATLGTGIAAAVFCSIAPEFPLRVLYMGNPVFLPAAQLVPLFCWCMLPLTAAYTLVNNLLARKRFAAVPWLLLVAVGYALTLASMRADIARRTSPTLEPDEIGMSLIHRLAKPDSPLETHLRDALPAQVLALVPVPVPVPSDTRSDGEPPRALTAGIVDAINPLLADPSLHDPERIRGIPLRPETRTLLERNPTGRDLARLNRLLLEDAFPDGIVRRSPQRLFDEFRRVIRTLGGFSVLLLAVSVCFSLPRRGEAKAGLPV